MASLTTIYINDIPTTYAYSTADSVDSDDEGSSKAFETVETVDNDIDLDDANKVFDNNIEEGIDGASRGVDETLLEVVQENRSILSIYGDISLTQKIKDVLQSNLKPEILGKREAISFESMVIRGYGSNEEPHLSPVDEGVASFSIRFFAPKRGNLVLRLHHNSSNIHATLTVKEGKENGISFRHTVPKKLVTENITLYSTTHFSPGTATTLTFVPDGGYNLYNIQLLDNSLKPYDANADASNDTDSSGEADGSKSMETDKIIRYWMPLCMGV
jgi:hypothetical protein